MGGSTIGSTSETIQNANDMCYFIIDGMEGFLEW